MLGLRRAIRKFPRAIANEKGQALMEFIMLVPLIMTFVWYLLHVNLAINKSIVAQQSARSQLFLKMFNHRSGPMQSDFGKTNRSHFYVGVAADVVTGSGAQTAPTERLGIGPNPAVSSNTNDAEGEAEPGSMRQDVRIRTVFGICTHRKVVTDQKRLTDFCGSEPGT